IAVPISSLAGDHGPRTSRRPLAAQALGPGTDPPVRFVAVRRIDSVVPGIGDRRPGLPAKTPRASSASKRVAPRGEIARGPELAVGRRARLAAPLPIRAAADAHAADEAATAIAPEDEVEIERSRGALALYEERTLHEV